MSMSITPSQNKISFGASYYGKRNMISKEANRLLDKGNEEIRILTQELKRIRHNQGQVNEIAPHLVATTPEGDKVTLFNGLLYRRPKDVNCGDYDVKVAFSPTGGITESLAFTTPAKHRYGFSEVAIESNKEIVPVIEDFIKEHMKLFIPKRRLNTQIASAAVETAEAAPQAAAKISIKG